MRVRASRLAAAGSVVLLLAGGLAVLRVLAAGAQPWTGGYVSEAGIGPGPPAMSYLSGVLAVSAGIALTGLALRGLSPLGGALLALAGAMGTVSAAVPCSSGCPLPPYERATPADLVHACASVLAVAAVILAMLVVGTRAPGTERSLRRLARVGFVGAVPLAGALGVGLLGVGRGAATSIGERAVLLAVYLWTVLTATLLASRRTGRRAPGAAEHRYTAKPAAQRSRAGRR